MKISPLINNACRLLVEGRFLSPSVLVGLIFLSLQGYSSEDIGSLSQQNVRVIPDDLFGVDFFDQQHGLISGYYGTVMKTTDAGQNWQHVDTGSKQLLRRVNMVSVDVAWAVGHRGGILKSSDGGSSWQLIAVETDEYLRDVDFFDEQVGWVVGHEATILFTDDGGKHWRQQKLSGYQGRDLPRLNGVVAIDKTRAILVGEFGVVAKTIDGGESWDLIEHNAKNTLTAVDWSEDYGIAVGLDGYGCRIEWSDNQITVLDTGSNKHLFDVSLNNHGEGYAVGRSLILGYSRGEFRKPRVDDDLELAYKWYGGVYTSDTFGVWAVGQRGEVIRLAEDVGAADASVIEGTESNSAQAFSIAYQLGSNPISSFSPQITREKNDAR